jgi:hypothetical protein
MVQEPEEAKRKAAAEKRGLQFRHAWPTGFKEACLVAVEE